MRKSGERKEPTFDKASGKTSPAEWRVGEDDRIGSARASKKSAGKSKILTESEHPPRKKRRRSRSLIGQLAYWCVVLGVWGGIGLLGLVGYHAAQLPPIDQLAIPKRPPNIAILGDDGAVLANRGDTGGPAIRLGDLPPYVPKAFIAIEDRRFYAHWGIDPIGILRAVASNASGRGNMQGGSTLTQQLAKNLFLTQERTVSRKIQEAILALWLEHRYSKDQLLELYLNRVYFGSGAYGIEAAAQKYFGHSARVVTLSEAAVLAGLMKAPTRLAPNRNPEGAAERATQVLTAMAQEGHISEAMAKVALARPAQAAHEGAAATINYAADYVMDVLAATVGAIDEDLVVTTTLSGALQNAAEQALTGELERRGGKFNVSQGAVVSMDQGGAIKALVGGRNYAESQFNRAVAAKRQPGSAFKPFVYLSAIERGLTPDSVREDGPINVKGWQPENYSHEYFGPVTLTNALALSLNTVAVRLGLEVGPRAVVATAHRLGIGSDLQANASIALGTSEVTPLELVTAYAPFANGGIGVQSHVILRVRTADGKLLYQRKGTSNGRIIDPAYVAMMNAMMQETLSTGTARKAELPGWQAAGKTGTSQDFRDAWFVGYTSRLVTGVWLGNDDNSPTKKASGGNLPVEIWSRFMKEAHRGIPPASLPGGTWRAIAPPADAPLPQGVVFNGQPRDPAGPPSVSGTQPGQPIQLGGRGATQRSAQSATPAPLRGLDSLLPAAQPAPRQREPAGEALREERSFIEKLFSGG